MTYDGTNRKHIRQAEKTAKMAEAARRNFIRSTMASFDGRAWMHALLAQCHIFHTSFAAGSPDITAFRLGEQNIGLQIFSDVVNHCPNEYVLMMQEANAKEAIDDRRYSESRPEPTEPTRTGEDARRDDQGLESDSDSGPGSGWYN